LIQFGTNFGWYGEEEKGVGGREKEEEILWSGYNSHKEWGV
jgi:hypothetical protein